MIVTVHVEKEKLEKKWTKREKALGIVVVILISAVVVIGWHLYLKKSKCEIDFYCKL